jgi:TP901 family phage tail tape measure protein
MSAAGAAEIGEALQRSAATASEARVPYQKLASWISTVSEKTRESASTIGNAMKSIMTRYNQIKEKGFNEEDATNINQVTKALKQAGIVSTTNDGQLRDFTEVLDELGEKWGILDEKTKAYIATQMAGEMIARVCSDTY